MKHYAEQNGAWYEFDLGRIRSRLEYLRSLLGNGIALAYAVKVNGMVLQHLIASLHHINELLRIFTL